MTIEVKERRKEKNEAVSVASMVRKFEKRSYNL
jgi:hypothetical protein